MFEDNLSKLGFSPTEIKVYMNLLNEGSSYPKEISFKTKINRSNVYEALDRLLSKGLISYITKNNIKWFEAKSPESIFTLIENKEEELKKTKLELKKDIKKINPLQEKSQLEANIFVGKKGLRIIFEDILNEKKDIFFFASKLQFKDFFGPYFELWHKKRISLGLKQRTIFHKDMKLKVKERKLLQLKFIDDKYANPTSTLIYGNNCVFIQWSKEPLAIKINNKEITRSHLNYFNMLWDLN
jgi:sugar-specific transcriptional regulator TrmB